MSVKVPRYSYLTSFYHSARIVTFFVLVRLIYVVLQFNVQRISFEEGLNVETVEEAKKALRKLLDRGRITNFKK